MRVYCLNNLDPQENCVKRNLSILLVLLTFCAILFFPPSIRAILLFIDSFSGGFNSSWYVPAGAVAPISSSFGITGADSTTWSVIQLPITENYTYQLQFDLKVNQENTSNAWGVGISNNLGAWKFAGNWGQLLQIHDSSGSDKLVNWTQSPGIHHFEVIVSPIGNTPFIVKEDGNLLYELNSIANFNISSIVVSILGKGDYEMANFALSTYESPTPTPTMEPTITPTPTPPNTPTPTPTPNLAKKVIVLHGVGGSWNKDAMMNCKSANYSGSWSPWKISNWDVYEPLINGLTDAGYEPIPYYYDWRQQVTTSASELEIYIQNTIPNDQTFNLVGHSLGGLVGRAYLEKTKMSSRLNKFMTVGSSHQGSVFAYPAWSGGDIWISDPKFQIGFTLMKALCSSRRNWTPLQAIHNAFPSIQNLLPTFDYLKDSLGILKPESSMVTQNNWLPTNTFNPPFYGVTVGSLSGSGYQTLQTLEVKPPSRIDKRIGNWLDGKPTENKTYSDGDGTVLTESSLLPGAQNTFLSLKHDALIYDQQGVATILNFLNGNDSLRAAAINTNNNGFSIKPSTGISALVIIIDGGRAILTDNVTSFEDTEGQITLLNPQNNSYKLTVTPDSILRGKAKYKIIVLQLFEDGTSKLKEYERHGLFKKHLRLRFDRAGKNEDILYDD